MKDDIMRKLLLSILAAAFIFYFSVHATYAMDQKFLEDMQRGGIRTTLNSKGNHYPTLGTTQDEFFRRCSNLENDTNIKNPVVAIWGGAYGKRAVEVLSCTKRVTVVLNDLDKRHFDDIKQWSKNNPLAKRLILAPGSYLNIHQNKGVQHYFKESAIKFHAILAANLFHFHTPLEFIQGLRYSADHLVDTGEMFLMTLRWMLPHDSKVVELIDRTLLTIKGLYNTYDPDTAEKIAETLVAQISVEGAEWKDTLVWYVKNRQVEILYAYNQEQGFPFPGYMFSQVDTLDPYFLKINNALSLRMSERERHFYTTPAQTREWTSSVGFSCLGTHYLKIDSDARIHPGTSDDSMYYFAHLKKTSSVVESKYQQLVTCAQNADQTLRELHANKIFTLDDNPPYFGITDVVSQKRYSRNVPRDLTSELHEITVAKYMKAITEERNDLAIYQLGMYYYMDIKNYGLATACFTFAFDMGIEGADQRLAELQSTR
jgi:hypothetical protein